MYARTRQERLSDAARAKQLRGRLKNEGRQNERVIVVTDRMRKQLMEAGLPYKRGELVPEMCDLLRQLADFDAVKIIHSHVMLWLERREQAVGKITKYTFPIGARNSPRHPTSPILSRTGPTGFDVRS